VASDASHETEEQPNNKNDTTSNIQSQHDTSNIRANNLDTIKNEALHTIPNMVNDILQHYITSNEKNRAQTANDHNNYVSFTVDQKILLTQLLSAVIIEFAEPHFIRMLKVQREHNRSSSSKKSKAEPRTEQFNNSSSLTSVEFSRRTVLWANSCLSQLLQSTLTIGESTHISELDALLGATGENDAVKMEERIQQSLICGVLGKSNSSGNVFDLRMGPESS